MDTKKMRNYPMKIYFCHHFRHHFRHQFYGILQNNGLENKTLCNIYWKTMVNNLY